MLHAKFQNHRTSVSGEDVSSFFTIYVQLLPKFFLDSDFCHNYLHTPVILNWLPYA